MRFRALLAAALVPVLASPALAQGCALCRRNLEQNGGQGLIRGFYWSILLLIGLPFVLVGTFAFLLWKARRKAYLQSPASVP